MQNNKALKDKYAHLEFSILPLSKALKDNETKRLDSEYFKKEYLENEELLKRFECQTLEELSTKITNGHTPYGENLLENEVKFITAEFIDDFTINKIKKFISMKSHSNYLKRSILNEGDIIFSIKGKIGNAVPIFNIQEPLNINQDVAKISLKNKINHFYVSAFLNSKYGKKQTEAEATGQINPFISLGVLKKIKIPLFDSSFQAEIEKIVKDSHHKLEQSKSLYKEAESLLYESLGSTNSACSEGNSSLGNHCIDLVFSHEARTQSPLSLCKNAKNSTSKTADTRIYKESMDDSAKDSGENNPIFANAKQSIESAESTKDFNIMDCHANPCGLSRNDASLSSLRGQRPKQSINKNNSCEAQPTLAPLRGSEIEEQGGSSASTLLELEADKARLSPKSEKRSFFRSAFASHQPLARCVGERGGGAALFAKKSDYINENISAESRRSERAESFTKNAESHKDSSYSMQSTLQNLKARFSHLNISIKPLSKSLQKSGRLDSEYYQAKYENIEALIKSYKWSLVSSFFQQNKTPCNFTEEQYNYIEIGDINISDGDINFNSIPTNELPANAKIAVCKNDILISKVRPNRGAVGIINFDKENLIASGAFTILREKGGFKKEVLQVLLRSCIYKELLLKYNVGTSYPVIKDDDILNLPIPLVDSQTQEQIASRLKLSFALKKEAKELLDLAKSKVECAIEGKIS